MAKFDLHDRAIQLRLEGKSYSQIKEEVLVSKSTLSKWLADYPLSPEKIHELRDINPKRIERHRNTMAKKREERFEKVQEQMNLELGELSSRELFIAGFFLYWAEGTKAARGTVCFTNTDPSMINSFIAWVALLGIELARFRIRLNLYSDMDIEKESLFWANTTGISLTYFRKPYIKESSSDKRVNYKGRFNHGTCNLILSDITLYEKIMAGIEHIRSPYLNSSIPPSAVV